MRRKNLRLRIKDDGGLEIVDPGFETVKLLRAIEPSFRIRCEPLAGFSSPRFKQLRQAGCGLAPQELPAAGESELWEAHDGAMAAWREGAALSEPSREEASILDLKIELARRMLSACRLCGHRCGVDRTQGEMGLCGLGIEGTVAEHFVHIAEEGLINPSLVLSLTGCGLRCRFCQQGEILEPHAVEGDPLEPYLWSHLSFKGARSLSFIGGNPDESIYAILRFLRGAPGNWKLPIVWNCNGYGTIETIKLLEGVVDVYLPDFKFSNEGCAQVLAAAPGYPGAARRAIAAMVGQGVTVIVRILVLPGHLECCHAPALEFLNTLPRANLFISVRGQYCPDWKITVADGELARRPTAVETGVVSCLARDLGLTLEEESRRQLGLLPCSAGFNTNSPQAHAS